MSFPADFCRALEGSTPREGDADVALTSGGSDLVDDVVSVVPLFACHVKLHSYLMINNTTGRRDLHSFAKKTTLNY